MFVNENNLGCRRSSRSDERPAHRADAGEHRERSSDSPEEQSSRQQLSLPQTRAETGGPASAGDRARSVSSGDQEDGGHVTASITAGDL